MKQLRSIACFAALSAASLLAQAPTPTPSPSERTGASRDGAAAPFQVGMGKRVEIAIAGATAAYSLDPAVADAGAANGVVVVEGRGPGASNVIVVTWRAPRPSPLSFP